MHVKKGDKVTVISGKYKGKNGKIIKALPKFDMVIVEGVNIKKRHTKARREGKKGEVVDKTMPIHVSNVKLTNEAKK